MWPFLILIFVNFGLAIEDITDRKILFGEFYEEKGLFKRDGNFRRQDEN